MDVIIVDDEPMAREIIESILTENFHDVNITGQAGTVKEAVELIGSINPQLVFLDVDLTDGSGFDVLSTLKKVNFKVIFITAHQKYAIKAIKFSAFDFILKPISTQELIEAVNRVKAEGQLNDQAKRWDAFFENISGLKPKLQKIVLKTSESIHLVQVDDIIRCEADNNYSTFYLANGEKILVSKGLKDYEELLKDNDFFRVHQSHLINLNYVLRFDKKDGGSVVLSDKSIVPVSQRKKQSLFEFFEKHN